MIGFLLPFVPDFMEIIEVDLADKRRVVSMFEKLGEYFFGELPNILDGKGSLLLVVKNDFLVLFVLVNETYVTLRISINLLIKPAILPDFYFFLVI